MGYPSDGRDRFRGPPYLNGSGTKSVDTGSGELADTGDVDAREADAHDTEH